MCAAHPLPEQRAGVGVAGFDAGGDGAPGRYVQSLGSTVVLGALPSSLTLGLTLESAAATAPWLRRVR